MLDEGRRGRDGRGIPGVAEAGRRSRLAVGASDDLVLAGRGVMEAKVCPWRCHVRLCCESPKRGLDCLCVCF
jgi:hypothetical protein